MCVRACVCYGEGDERWGLQLAALCTNDATPSGELEERQNKMQREVVDARHGVTFVMVSEGGWKHWYGFYNRFVIVHKVISPLQRLV